MDIDWFKSINDTYGHDAGDRVLQEVADLLKSMIRTTDTLARWGGEEFLILCPGTNIDDSVVIAQKIQKAIEKNSFFITDNITISAGTSEYRPDILLEDLLIEVDRKLYKAKEGGRNQVVI